jgi:hypothetical protein
VSPFGSGPASTRTVTGVPMTSRLTVTKNSIERTIDMQSVQLQKKVEEHERRFGPLGGAAPSAVADGLPQALTKADELQEAHPNMSSAEAFRRIMRDPAVAAQYEKERGRAQGAAPAVVGLSKCEAVAEGLCKSDPRMSAAEGFRQAMGTPAIRDAYARETGYVGPGRSRRPRLIAGLTNRLSRSARSSLSAKASRGGRRGLRPFGRRASAGAPALPHKALRSTVGGSQPRPAVGTGFFFLPRFHPSAPAKGPTE